MAYMGFDIPHITNFTKRILIFPMGKVRMALNGQLIGNNGHTLKGCTGIFAIYTIRVVKLNQITSSLYLGCP